MDAVGWERVFGEGVGAAITMMCNFTKQTQFGGETELLCVGLYRHFTKQTQFSGRMDVAFQFVAVVVYCRQRSLHSVPMIQDETKELT